MQGVILDVGESWGLILGADGYTGCLRQPASAFAEDQQGWPVERASVTVTESAASAQATPTPTAGRIAFASNRGGGDGDYVMNTDGSVLTRLTDNSWDDMARSGTK